MCKKRRERERGDSVERGDEEAKRRDDLFFKMVAMLRRTWRIYASFRWGKRMDLRGKCDGFAEGGSLHTRAARANALPLMMDSLLLLMLTV